MQNNAFTRLTLLIVYNFNCRIKICNSVYGFCLILYFNSAKFLGQFTRFSELIYVVTCWPEITSSQKGNIWSILISTVYHLANWITVQNYQSWPISAEIIWLVADIYAFEGTSLVLSSLTRTSQCASTDVLWDPAQDEWHTVFGFWYSSKWVEKCLNGHKVRLWIDSKIYEMKVMKLLHWDICSTLLKLSKPKVSDDLADSHSFCVGFFELRTSHFDSEWRLY